MANSITEQKLIDSTKRALLKYVIVSDGTQDANTLLLDASSLAFSLNANGYIMSSNTHPKSSYKLTVKRIFGQLASNTGLLRIKWNNSTNSDIVVASSGGFDYDFQSMGDGATIPNPEPTSSGDILISTGRLSNGDAATIFLDLKKDARDFDQGQTADPYAFNKVLR